MALSVQDFRLDDIKQFSSFASDIDLVDGSQSNIKRPAAYIYIDTVGTGSLTLQFTDGTSETLTVAAGRELIGKFCKILSMTTNVALLTVGWIG